MEEEFFDDENMFSISEIENVVGREYHDQYIKEIGDRVSVEDYSSMTHENGMELDFPDFDELFDVKYFIVIAVRQKIVFTSKYADYKQDLLIVNSKTNKQYRIISGHCKHFN